MSLRRDVSLRRDRQRVVKERERLRSRLERQGRLTPRRWLVYVLTLDDGYLYVGLTQNLPVRLQEHTASTEYVIAHGGIAKVNVLARDILSLEEAETLERRAVENLRKRGYDAEATPWRDTQGRSGVELKRPWQRETWADRLAAGGNPFLTG